MKIIAQNPIFIQNRSFMGKTVPVKPFVAKKKNLNNPDNLPLKNLNPAYFHPSFCANLKSIKAFDEFMESLIKNPQNVTKETEKELLSLFKNAAKVSKKNYINRGMVGKVYRISDKFVFKINSDINKVTNKYSYCRISVHNLNKDLDVFYGEELARIGNATILKNAVGDKKATVIGAPINKFIFDFSARIYYKRHKFAQKLAAMPQEAFDKVVLNFKALNKEQNLHRGTFYGFDYENPNNFLLVGDEIRITDAIDDVTESNFNNIGGMLNSFVTQVGVDINAIASPKLAPARKEIFKKCFLASERAELPLTWGSYDTNVVNSALKLLEIKRDAKSMNSKLQHLRKTIPDVDKRLEATENYLDKIV